MFINFSDSLNLTFVKFFHEASNKNISPTAKFANRAFLLFIGIELWNAYLSSYNNIEIKSSSF